LGSTPSLARGAAVAAAALLIASFTPAAAPAAPGLDAVPPKSEPFRWVNEQGRQIECPVTPWQLIDLGTIGGVRIYAGDHCSVPMSDPGVPSRWFTPTVCTLYQSPSSHLRSSQVTNRPRPGWNGPTW